MSDIAKRLRASVAINAVYGNNADRSVVERQMGEAAAEIERLREELASVTADRDERAVQKGEMFDEIERLRREGPEDFTADLAVQLALAKHEIERLRAELREAAHEAECHGPVEEK
jgi:chromosome segregation ATPase